MIEPQFSEHQHGFQNNSTIVPRLLQNKHLTDALDAGNEIYSLCLDFWFRFD